MGKKTKKVMRTLDGRLVRLCAVCQSPYASVSGTTTKCLNCRLLPHQKENASREYGVAEGSAQAQSENAGSSFQTEMKEKRGLDLQEMFLRNPQNHLQERQQEMGGAAVFSVAPTSSAKSLDDKDEIVDVDEESTDTEADSPVVVGVAKSHSPDDQRQPQRRGSKKCSFRPAWQSPPRNKEKSDADNDDENVDIPEMANAPDNERTCWKHRVAKSSRKRLRIETTATTDETSRNEDQQTKRTRTVTPDSFVDKVDEPNSLLSTAAHEVEKQESSPDLEDCCFICGTSFTGRGSSSRARILHMKRCAKTYGVTLQQVAKFDNHDHGELGNEEDDDSVIDLTEQPQGDSQDGGWHEDALVVEHVEEEDTAISMQGEATTATTEAENATEEAAPQEAKTSKQSTMNNFFKAPKRSVNAVLLASARNASQAKLQAQKEKEITRQDVEKQGPKGGGRRGRRRFGQQQRPPSGSCPSYKRIPGTDFICDGFHYATPALSTTYFLTHFHSDHYGGITSQWNAGTIFCSLPTANLLHQQLKVDRKYLHPLALQTPTVIESKSGGAGALNKSVTVTLLDANHCPGAVMFLFQVANRSILHVGDFRWHATQMLNASLPLRAFAELRPRLDELFLDTTYCDPQYAGMPTQQEAIRATVEVAQRELEQGKRLGVKVLLLFGSYTIGKERIYLAVAQQLGLQVYVEPRKWRILSQLQFSPDTMKLFTTRKEESSLWVVPLGAVNFRDLRKFGQGGASQKKVFSKGYGRVVGFQPTGWSFSAKRKGGGSPHSSGNNSNLLTFRSSGMYRIYGVPYSEHSSFAELVDCLVHLKPKRIVPTVSVSKSDQQVEMLLEAVRERRERDERERLAVASAT